MNDNINKVVACNACISRACSFDPSSVKEHRNDRISTVVECYAENYGWLFVRHKYLQYPDQKEPFKICLKCQKRFIAEDENLPPELYLYFHTNIGNHELTKSSAGYIDDQR